MFTVRPRAVKNSSAVSINADVSGPWFIFYYFLRTIETLLHSQTNQKIANFQHSPLITSKMVSICTF